MSTSPTAGHGLTNSTREVIASNPNWARTLARLVDVDDPRTRESDTITHRVEVADAPVAITDDRLRTWRARDLLDRVGRTSVRRVDGQTGVEPIVVYRIPDNVRAATQALADHHREREGWCTDPDCGRTAVVNDGEPRCVCGAPLREVTES